MIFSYILLSFSCSATIAIQLPSHTTDQCTSILNISQQIHILRLSIILDYYANTNGETIFIMSVPIFGCYLFSTRLLDVLGFFLYMYSFESFLDVPAKHSEQDFSLIISIQAENILKGLFCCQLMSSDVLPVFSGKQYQISGRSTQYKPTYLCLHQNR